MSNRRRTAFIASLCGLLAAPVLAQPAVADADRNDQWHLGALNVTEAQRFSKGDGVTVGVIDSGVKADHPDLVDNVLPGVDLSGGNTRGMKDDDGHGTGMAGLIAAHGHGSSSADGALGIAPHAKILPVRVPADLHGTSSDVARAINEAVQHGAKIVSISLTTGMSSDLKQAVEDAIKADVIVVAGSGNRPDVLFSSPASYPGVVAVGATDKSGNLASVTVTGKEMVLTAPGVDIVSTDGIGGYRIGTGTSDSTAIVAGAAALVRSKYPNLKATEVIHRLTATATDKGAPGRDPEYGYGVLNLVGALTADVPPETSAPTAPAPSGSATAAPAIPSEPLKLSPVFYVFVAFLGLLLLGGIALLAFFLVRRNKRKPVYGPPPPAYQQQPPR